MLWIYVIPVYPSIRGNLHRTTNDFSLWAFDVLIQGRIFPVGFDSVYSVCDFFLFMRFHYIQGRNLQWGWTLFHIVGDLVFSGFLCFLWAISPPDCGRFIP
jgi:hypothetical protein